MSFIEIGVSVHVATPGVFPNHTPQGSYLNAYFDLNQKLTGDLPQGKGHLP